MSAPDPLAAFVEARLQEDEAAALAAARSFGQDWHAELAGGDVVTGRVYGKSRDRYVAEAMRGSGSVHIASHDPARVLRDVAAKRAILAEHWAHSEPERWIDGPKAGQATGRTAYWCSTCDQDRDYGYISGPQEGCATLRHLAAIDASHPDYDPAWAPGSS